MQFHISPLIKKLRYFNAIEKIEARINELNVVVGDRFRVEKLV